MSPPGGPPYTPAWQSLAHTLAVFDEKIAKARAALVAVTDLELAQPWTLKKGGEKVFTAPRGSVLRSFVLNHSVHHRAQLGVYLRMLDVPVSAMSGPDGGHQVGRPGPRPASGGGAEQHHRNPEDVGDEQVHDLHPHRREQDHVREAERDLQRRQPGDGDARMAIVVAQARERQPRAGEDQNQPDAHGQRGMQDAQANQHVRRRRRGAQAAPASRPGTTCRRAPPPRR